MKTRVRIGAGLLVLAFLASACEAVDMQVGQTQSRTNEATVTFTQVDAHIVDAFSNGKQTERYNCKDGLAAPLLVSNTLTVDCVENPAGKVQPTVTDVLLDKLGADQIAMPPDGDMEDMSAQPMTELQSVVYCSGGKGWTTNDLVFQDRRGNKPDSSSDALNWKIIYNVKWCVRSGVVSTGLTLTDTVINGRMREIADRTWTYDPPGLPSRTFSADYDFMFGWCPWCTDIDADIRVTVRNDGRYSVSLSHNGDGF